MTPSPVRLKLSPDERGAEGLYGIALTACLLSLLELPFTYNPTYKSRLPLSGTCRASIDNLRNANYKRLLPDCLLTASDLSLPTDTGHLHGVLFCCLSYPPLPSTVKGNTKPKYRRTSPHTSIRRLTPPRLIQVHPSHQRCIAQGALCLSLPHPSDTLPRLCWLRPRLRPRPRSLDPRFTHLLRYNYNNNTPCDGLLLWASSPPPLRLF